MGKERGNAEGRGGCDKWGKKGINYRWKGGEKRTRNKLERNGRGEERMRREVEFKKE